MNNRIKGLRSALQLSQEDFATSLNLSRNFVWMLEKGEREPSDRTIKDICRNYNVNEEWLRSGSGEMFIEISKEKKIADLTAQVYKRNDLDELTMANLVAMAEIMFDMTDDEIKAITKLAHKLAKETELPK